MATGRIAYANARVRALKSQLLDPDLPRRLRAAPAAQSPAFAAGEALDIAELPSRSFRRLVHCYAVVLASYPSGHELFRALVRLHEIENLKLVWRARSRQHPFERWQRLWRPLGVLETVRLDEVREHTSLAGFVVGLRGTPYGTIADATLRAHADDLAASELAFDRWASSCIARAAAGLGRGESAARGLAMARVRERELELLRRGVRVFGLSADAVRGSLAVVLRELPAREVDRLATWTAEGGPLLRAWPRAWPPVAGVPADWDALLVALKRARREACRRAFLGPPYCLAPAVALLLLCEEEVRGAVALRESGARSGRSAALDRALAASAMGA
jgi:hypothetical protein